MEQIDFEPHVVLDGKVEVYLQTTLKAQQRALALNLQRSIHRHPSQARTDWLLNKHKDRPTDPAQIALLVAGVMNVREVEDAMGKIGEGEGDALTHYQTRAAGQLVDLIKRTQTSSLSGELGRLRGVRHPMRVPLLVPASSQPGLPTPNPALTLVPLH